MRKAFNKTWWPKPNVIRIFQKKYRAVIKGYST